MLDTAADWVESHFKTVGLILTGLAFAFKRVRAFCSWVFRGSMKWLAKDRLEFQEEIRGHIARTNKERESDREAIREIKEMAIKADKALFNGGRAGIVQQMQLLVAESNVGFETSPYPSFKCDQDGNNILTNAAYRRLIGATRESSLAGHQWISVTYGELEKSYIEGFMHASKLGEDFVGEVDFRQPMTGEHVGRWRVVAPVVNVGEGLIYLGVLKIPVDETAEKIAKEFLVG